MLDGPPGLPQRLGDGGVEGLFLALEELVDVDVAIMGAAILLLLDLEDVGGPLDAGQKILAVVGLEEFRQRRDALDDHQQIVLIAKREHGVDQVVPGALFF